MAELTATVIAGLYGSDWSGNCWQYLSHAVRPTQGGALALCLSVLSEVEQVLAEIFQQAAAI